MAYAAREGFIVFTHDLDFSAILAASHGLKPSVVQVRGAEVRPEVVGETVVRAEAGRIRPSDRRLAYR
jgi:predicted nuclease of predicted toxin-antitoxin system